MIHLFAVNYLIDLYESSFSLALSPLHSGSSSHLMVLDPDVDGIN